MEQGPELLVGPTLRATYDAIALAARCGPNVHLVGESGSGKELAARAFHDARSSTPKRFVAVNCAAIPEGVAERLLFGAVRGAYSGADATVDGYIQAADGGTLFLDEVAELELAVQAKLLRVLETHEVLALGASRPERVDFGLCTATHRELRAAVAAGEFREDLFFRIGRPDVRVPPLRERREEMPWHIARALARIDADLTADASFVETCMLRRWPGNVREILNEVRLAAQNALAKQRRTVSAELLAPTAGMAIVATPEPEPERATSPQPDRAAVEAALRENAGNVTAAARTLGMHRNQLRRWLTKEGLDPTAFGDER
jgi:transcriptional regulator with GAF, ATPase, and Fis domain